MEVRKGYKQTEVGIIPEDWNLNSIGDVLTVKHGRNQKEVKSENGLYPILGTGGFMGLSSKWLYDKESVLIGRKGTIDKPRYMNSPFWTVDTLFYTEINEGFLPKYIYFKFLMIDWQSHNEASGVPSLNAKTIEKIPISFPPTKAEQVAIATALNDADVLISSLEKLIEKKRVIKQGAMQELLRPKEGWEVKKLGDILKSIQLGGNYQNTERVTPSPLIKMGNIQRGYISTKKIEYINENHKPQEKDRLKFGDILFNTRNTLELVGKVSVWRDELPKAYFNSNLMRMEFNPELISSSLFMNYILNTRNSISGLKDIATGTTSVAAIYTRDLITVEVSIPRLEVQTHIATILSDIDSEIAGLEEKLSKYKMVKQGMMQELLTGRIRLNH